MEKPRVLTIALLCTAFTVLMDFGLRASDFPWLVLPCWGGGYVQNVVLCPGTPGRMYLYVDVGGPYRSDDSGASWRPLHAEMPVAMRERGFDQIRSLSVDPRNADNVVILAGRDGDTLGGFAVTRDGGATWSIKQDAFAYGNSPRRSGGFCLSRSPFDPDELVGGEDRSGIFVSRDNGETWMLTGPTGVLFTDIRHDATVPGRIYASAPYISTNQLSSAWVLGDSRTTPRGYGFYRSNDGARTWQRLSDESPTEIAQIPGDTCIVGLFDKQHVRVSYDGGETWMPFEDGLFIRDSPSSESVIGGAYCALAAGRDFWLVGDGIGAKYRRGSADTSWERLPDGLLVPGDPANEPRLSSFSPGEIRMTALSTLVTDPRDARHWLATDWFELWETFNAGTNWTSRMRGIMPLVSYDIAFDPNSADNFFCCLYDVGAVATRDGGRTFIRARAAAGSSGNRIFPNNVAAALYLQGRPGVVLLAGARGNDTGLWRSEDAGLTWSPLPATGLPALVPDSSAVSCLVQDPLDGSVLLTMSGAADSGVGRVYRSRDEGVTWTLDGGGLGDGESFDYGTNHSQGAWPRLVVSLDGSAVTVAQRDDGHFYSRGPVDAAWSKTSLTPPGWRKYPLAADPFVPGRFLCGGGDRTVQESTDGGRTWHTYAPLQGRKCGGIAFDRHESGSVVFACSDGLYHSADGGATLRLLEDGLRLPSGTSRTIALDRGRLFFLTSGSGIWGKSLADLRMAPGLPQSNMNFGIVPVLLKTPDRLVTAITAHQAAAANGGDLFVVEYEGCDFSNRVVAVAGLAAGDTASLSFGALGGQGSATLTASADSDGFAVFDVPVAPGTNYTYAVAQAGKTLCSGTLRAGRWGDDGAWFRAEPDGRGGSTEIGGVWTSPPVATNAASYYAGITSEFALSEETRAAGGGRIVRAEIAISYAGMRSLASLSDLPCDGSLAAVTVVETGEGGATAWAACVGGVWRTMHGAAPPVVDVEYLIRMEGDFTLASPRVRLSVSADGGLTYETLLAPDGAEWFVPNDPSRRVLSSLAADGGAELGGFRGELANVFVAEVGGVGYASLLEALRAAGHGGTVTLLTDASAPKALAVGRTIVDNGHSLTLFGGLPFMLMLK